MVETPLGSGPPDPDRGDPPRYVERLRPAGWVWAFALFIGVGIGLSLSALGSRVGLVSALGSCLVISALLIRTTPVVEVAGGSLRAGTAHVPIALLGAVDVLDAGQMRRALGPGLDARAHLCLRGWIATGVRLTLTDPADPAPYWLVSSRRPEQLAEAVRAARS